MLATQFTDCRTCVELLAKGKQTRIKRLDVNSSYILQTLFWQLINAALGRREVSAGHLVNDAHVTGAGGGAGGGGPQHSAFEHLRGREIVRMQLLGTQTILADRAKPDQAKNSLL
jgi:hypothetical protein